MRTIDAHRGMAGTNTSDPKRNSQDFVILTALLDVFRIPHC